MKKDFYYLSSDGETQIHAVKWSPEGEPVAVLQLVHGMVEYIERYSGFAEYMAGRGVLVFGHDHLGHGQSVKNDDAYGYFREKDGNAALLSDIDTLRKIASRDYPNLPYFIMGHSMGSFLTRQYIERYGKGLSGAIIMGTGSQPTAVLNTARALCSLIAAFKGWKHRSRLIDGLAFGSYNKAFKPERTSKDWLTKDNGIVDAYVSDPRCTFMFTLNGYHNLFYSIKDCQKKQNIAKIPKDLPVFFVAGKDDPVGGFGKGVEKAYDGFVKVGVKDVQIKLYSGDRHELLNETDRRTVYADIGDWLMKKIQ